MLDERRRRIAENESRFRDINERLRDSLSRLPQDGRPLQFVCECGHADCTEMACLTFEEYEQVRADPQLFAVLPGHEIEDAEDVVSRTARFVVVRKKPPTRPIVEAADPRA